MMTAQGGGTTSCSVVNRNVPAYLPRDQLGNALTDYYPDAFFQHQTQASKVVKLTSVMNFAEFDPDGLAIAITEMEREQQANQAVVLEENTKKDS